MLKRAALPVVAVLCLAGCQKTAPPRAAGGFPPTPVTVAKAEQKNIPVQVRQIGSVEAISTITVKAQIGGELTEVRFKDGQDLKKGDLLFVIDPRPYQQAIDQAQASLDKDTALIAQAEANLARDRAQTDNSRIQAQRYSQLLKEGVVSKEQNETYQTTLGTQTEAVKADEAAITSAKAAVNSDRAALETAKLNLSYCYIHSPIDGRAGALLVQAGNLVKANDTNALVNINQIAPVYVTFSVPEQQLSEVRRLSAGRSLDVDALVDGDTGKRAVTGKLTFIDNSVDNTTGTIKLKATFANQDRSLWPGEFVNVVMTLRTINDAVVVPSEAIQTGQQGSFAFVVKANQTVEPRVVTLGETIDKVIVVQQGIAAGETVVTDGQMRLFPGAPIRVAPPTQPGAGSTKGTGL